MIGVTRRIAVVAVVAALAGMTGCATVGPDFRHPKAALPERWAVEAAGTSHDAAMAAPDIRWWRRFDDPVLSSLIERVAAANLDVKLATTRWMQARAARRITGADARPALNGSASYQRARSSQNGLLDISGLDGKKAYTVWQPGVDASWELDLWGRVRREIESADATVEVSEDLRRGVLLSVLAETASDYMQLRGVQAQQVIVAQNLNIARHSQRLTQIRFTDGVATNLETAEASALVSAIEAKLPLLENDRLRLVNALSYLLGEPPHALESELRIATAVPSMPSPVPLGLPSELAARRPDVRAAEARLHAATANIGVAVGDFYPRVTLSANAGVQASRFSDLGQWSSKMFGIGPALSVPIFEGGRLKGQLALRKAQQQEAMIDFQRTVLSAWHEVDDAMSDYDARQHSHEKLAETVAQDRTALDNANRQYVAGAADFLQVLTVQRDLLAAQQALVTSSTDVSTSLVGLYKALGGGWEATFPVAPSAAVPAALAANSQSLSE